ncbi:MAG: hypothetical protein KatS3mg104_0913 [Phycisphaerae bacterium]|nr:MAG: hypothetical protein KatS3mg104_0913 [Phycisphaerae bacterium]
MQNPPGLMGELSGRVSFLTRTRLCVRFSRNMNPCVREVGQTPNMIRIGMR